MAFLNWLNKLSPSDVKEMQRDIACKILDSDITRPFEKIPRSMLIHYFDLLLTECHEKGVNFEQEYGSDK